MKLRDFIAKEQFFKFNEIGVESSDGYDIINVEQEENKDE